MSPKGKLFATLAIAALAAPAIALAQQPYGQPQDPQYGGAGPYSQSQPGYGQPAGPEGYAPDQGPGPGGQAVTGARKHHKHAGVYPQFRSLEKHIRHTLRDDRTSNTIASDDAHHLLKQLHHIQAEEQAVYQAHGANLPPDAQTRIQGELTQLAQTVDQSRGQANEGRPYQGQR